MHVTIQENLDSIPNMKDSAQQNAEQYIKLSNEMFCLWRPNLNSVNF